MFACLHRVLSTFGDFETMQTCDCIAENCWNNIWLVVWNIFYFSIIYGIILPIDFHIFQDGWNHQPDMCSQCLLNQTFSTTCQMVCLKCWDQRLEHPWWKHASFFTAIDVNPNALVYLLPFLRNMLNCLVKPCETMLNQNRVVSL